MSKAVTLYIFCSPMFLIFILNTTVSFLSNIVSVEFNGSQGSISLGLNVVALHNVFQTFNFGYFGSVRLTIDEFETT